MKTNKFFTAVISFSLVIFMSSSGISNPVVKSTGDIVKKTEGKGISAKKKSIVLPAFLNEAIAEFSYLRFDVNEYTTESAIEELPLNSFDYLRFDVDNFINDNETVEMELPAANEFDYLRFDVNNFAESNPVEISELPANEYDYLRFDVSKYASQSESAIDELPITE
jgi:hypothetical protein